MSDVVVAPNRHALFLVQSAAPVSELALVDIDASRVMSTKPILSAAPGVAPPWGGMAAVAADGTFLALVSTGLVAVTNGAVRWQVPMDVSRVSDLFVDSDATVVVATQSSVDALNLATGTLGWSVPTPGLGGVRVAPAGPDALYLLGNRSLALLSD